MSSLVRLEPPYSRTPPQHRKADLPVLRGPRLARTRAMSRWHRPRSGVAHMPRAGREQPYVTYQLWCGQFLNRSTGYLFAAELPDDEPLCGTCEGRAIGASHPPIAVTLEKALLFEPESQRPAPPICPAAGMHESLLRDLPNGLFPCPVCGEATRVRACGRAYDWRVKVEGHAPGPDLVDPCPFHRWDHLVIDGARAVCACSLPSEAVA